MDTATIPDEPSGVREAIRRGLATGRPLAPLRWWDAAKSRISRWSELDVTRKAAALSYYAAFSVVPILVIALWVGALVVDAANLRTHVMAQIGGLFGPTTSKWVESAIAQAGDMKSGIAAIISLVLLIVGATTSLAELKSSLDEIFGSDGIKDEGWLTLVRARAYALGARRGERSGQRHRGRARAWRRPRRVPARALAAGEPGRRPRRSASARHHRVRT